MPTNTSEDEPDFWAALDGLVAHSSVEIDRQRGSAHPRYPDLIYPLDYGYLAGTQAADRGGIDVWLGSGPGRSVTQLIVTLDELKRDAEVKILLGCSAGEARQVCALHRSGAQAALLIERS